MTSKRAKRRQRGRSRKLKQHLVCITVDATNLESTLPLSINITIDFSGVNAAVEVLQQTLVSEGFQSAVRQAVENFTRTCAAVAQYSQSLSSQAALAQKTYQCGGCRHWHGQVYNGVPLICAMHPYGPDAEACSDWEGGGSSKEPMHIAPF